MELCGKILGAVNTSVYIYMVPVITVIAVFGIVLTLMGLFNTEIKTSAMQKELKR